MKADSGDFTALGGLEWVSGTTNGKAGIISEEEVDDLLKFVCLLIVCCSFSPQTSHFGSQMGMMMCLREEGN